MDSNCLSGVPMSDDTVELTDSNQVTISVPSLRERAQDVEEDLRLARTSRAALFQWAGELWTQLTAAKRRNAELEEEVSALLEGAERLTSEVEVLRSELALSEMGVRTS